MRCATCDVPLDQDGAMEHRGLLYCLDHLRQKIGRLKEMTTNSGAMPGPLDGSELTTSIIIDRSGTLSDGKALAGGSPTRTSPQQAQGLKTPPQRPAPKRGESLSPPERHAALTDIGSQPSASTPKLQPPVPERNPHAMASIERVGSLHDLNLTFRAKAAFDATGSLSAVCESNIASPQLPSRKLDFSREGVEPGRSKSPELDLTHEQKRALAKSARQRRNRSSGNINRSGDSRLSRGSGTRFVSLESPKRSAPETNRKAPSKPAPSRPPKIAEQQRNRNENTQSGLLKRFVQDHASARQDSLDLPQASEATFDSKESQSATSLNTEDTKPARPQTQAEPTNGAAPQVPTEQIASKGTEPQLLVGLKQRAGSPPPPRKPPPRRPAR